MSSLQDPEILLQATALMGMASFCVWTGAKRSLPKEDENIETESISSEDALKFPFLASGALFSIYIVLRYVDPAWVATLMTVYFALLGAFGVQAAISPSVTKMLIPLVKTAGDKMKVCFIDGKENPVDLAEFTRGSIVSLVIGSIISGIYVATRHWISTNIIAMCIVIFGLQTIKIDNFKVACILLSGLFLYDIFWVFGTDVMVTVSKGVDGPIKIIFPSDIITGGIMSKRHGILGLGDIMIPGIVVAMMYRFDMSRTAGQAKPATPYFHATWAAYVAGLVITFIALHVSKHAQPALLYLSPIGIITPLCTAWVRGEMKELFAYNEAETKKDDVGDSAKKAKEE